MTVRRSRHARAAPSGVRLRLLLAMVGASVLAVGAVGLAFEPQLQRRLHADRINELRALLRTARPALADLSSDGPSSLAGLADRLAERAGGRIVIFGRGGRVVADSGPSDERGGQFGQALAAARAADTGDDGVRAASLGPYIVAAADAGSGDDRRTLVVAKRLDDTRAALSVVRGGLPLALLGGIAVAVVLAVMLSRWLVARLRLLAADAQALAGDGLAHRVTVSGRDEITTVALALETMRSRLAAEEAERTAFLATASHELRTPLAALQATLELLREEVDRLSGADTTVLAGNADAALRQTHRLVSLSEELLELSRLDSGAEQVVEPLDVLALCELVAAEYAARAGESGRRIDVAGEPLQALASPVALARIVTILVDNAYKYGEGPIQVRCSCDDEAVVVAVADEGAGVDPADRDRIFARFERGSAAGSAPGAGLGLSIATGLASAIGAELTVADGPVLNRFLLRLVPASADDAIPTES